MKPLKIGVYRRVSTEDQVNVFEGSLDSQKFRIDEFVKFKNSQAGGLWGEIIDYYDEEGVSAGTTNRPEYQRLMSDIRNGRVNMILVSDLTRLSRNLLDFCGLIDELEKYKASYLSMKEQFDTSTPIGRMIVFIVIALGQFERETTSERVAVNCHTRAIKGFLNGGPAPLGYDKDSEKKGLLVINEVEAQIVRDIFNIFLEEGSRSKTITRLHEKNIFPKRTSQKSKEKSQAQWTVQTLGSILSSVSYIGLREVNKMYKDEPEEHLKPWQRYQMVKAAWPAIIEEQVFYDAQALLEEASANERARLQKGVKRAFLLTGLLTCGELGLPLLGQTGKGRSGVTHRYYHYSRTPKGAKIVRPRLHADDLEEIVVRELKAALTTEGYFSDLAADIRKLGNAQNDGARSERKRLETESAEIQNRISAVWSNQSKMQLSEDALRLASEELNRLAKTKTDLDAQIKKLGPVDSSDSAPELKALFVENQVKMCMQGWSKATPAIKKRLLRRTIKEIIVTRDELFITFWTSAMEQNNAIGFEGTGESGEGENIIPIRRRSASGRDHNLSINGSGDVRIGRPTGTRTPDPPVMSGML